MNPAPSSGTGLSASCVSGHSTLGAGLHRRIRTGFAARPEAARIWIDCGKRDKLYLYGIEEFAGSRKSCRDGDGCHGGLDA